LDRDGVLIEDRNLLTKESEVILLPGVAAALSDLVNNGYKLAVVSNQTVVSRGLCEMDDVIRVNRYIADLILREGGPNNIPFYVCPHHPKATNALYRLDCLCRKPKPGLLLEAARENAIDIERSIMIGDRISDVWAGNRAGCLYTIHIGDPSSIEDKRIECDELPTDTGPDSFVATLLEAIELVNSL
jgi:histidinol-phosphate phosphatase family protein